jgi:predicted MFS family arabinose efflux permease
VVIGLVAGVILLDFGQQGALVSNQHIIYSLRPEARNRMNTIFMGIMFAGGAAGSAGASFAWQLGGWRYVSLFGALLSLIPVVIQFL